MKSYEIIPHRDWHFSQVGTLVPSVNGLFNLGMPHYTYRDLQRVPGELS